MLHVLKPFKWSVRIQKDYNGLNNKGLNSHKTYRSTLQPLRKQMERFSEQSKPPRESSHCKPLM